MRTRIDESGRVVIPKAIRDQAGIQAGTVEIYVNGAGIRIEPLADDSVTEARGRLMIPRAGKVLTDEVVRDLRDAGRARTPFERLLTETP